MDDYLNGTPSRNYSDSWIFSEIEEGHYLFEEPDKNLSSKVLEIRNSVYKEIQSFVPFNDEIWNELFPESQQRLSAISVQLVVGCPYPYEAMVREDADHREVIVFDLIRFTRYGWHRASEIVRAMLTHECVHILLHQDYPENRAAPYQEKMDFLLFDEGLAHFLSMDERINHYDWNSAESITRKKKSFRSFTEAFEEQDEDKQNIMLKEACTGHFWDKFACIAGMFLWAAVYSVSGIHGVKRTYASGWKKFKKNMD